MLRGGANPLTTLQVAQRPTVWAHFGALAFAIDLRVLFKVGPPSLVALLLVVLQNGKTTKTRAPSKKTRQTHPMVFADFHVTLK